MLSMFKNSSDTTTLLSQLGKAIIAYGEKPGKTTATTLEETLSRVKALFTASNVSLSEICHLEAVISSEIDRRGLSSPSIESDYKKLTALCGEKRKENKTLLKNTLKNALQSYLWINMLEFYCAMYNKQASTQPIELPVATAKKSAHTALQNAIDQHVSKMKSLSVAGPNAHFGTIAREQIRDIFTQAYIEIDKTLFASVYAGNNSRYLVALEGKKWVLQLRQTFTEIQNATEQDSKNRTLTEPADDLDKRFRTSAKKSDLSSEQSLAVFTADMQSKFALHGSFYRKILKLDTFR